MAFHLGLVQTRTKRNGTERHGTVLESKGIFAGVYTRTTRNVPLMLIYQSKANLERENFV